MPKPKSVRNEEAITAQSDAVAAARIAGRKAAMRAPDSPEAIAVAAFVDGFRKQREGAK